ncbi:uncharacterized protein HKBW3S25_01115 [Candidatus Hakubella thermalkaliphila]|uniref:Uncharacterized protein n=1 Tax=Candidatus Hakubella thermalkaliphila TaxID=2754717 RepID=A0A6V8NZE3_9ACTN|nr:uncharacterized protein HKBW3S25_01115 [Candidatus Hakubella thermalkaliphila]
MFRHKVLLISVNRSAAETSLYEATRYAWKISQSKAKQAEVILASVLVARKDSRVETEHGERAWNEVHE